MTSERSGTSTIDASGPPGPARDDGQRAQPPDGATTAAFTTIAKGTELGGRYRLDDRIAVGGMGEVWRAEDTVLGRHVAAKVLRTELTDRAGFLERFRREARNLAMLSHPSIAAVFDYGDHDGLPYLIMELVPGETLAHRIGRHGTMSPTEVADLIGQVAAGLAAAHDLGLVHRDVKPANLIITDSGKVKITDFGISRHADSHTLTSTDELLGTPQYMAPEQFEGATATAASDAYSLAVVAYELLAGRPPFTNGSNIAIAYAQVHEAPPPLPPTVPQPLADLVERALAKDPALRPPDGQAMAHEVAQAVAAIPTTTQEVGRGGSQTRADVPLAPTVALVSDHELAAAAGLTEVDVRPPVQPGPDDPPVQPLIGPMHRHRTKRLIGAGVAGLMVLVLVAAIVLGSRRDGSLDDAVTASGPATTAVTAESTIIATTEAPTTAAPPPTAVATVTVDPAAYIGRDHKEVVDELRSLGFVVAERKVSSDGAKKNSVVAVEPSGPLAPGSHVEVQVAKPGKGRGD
ncbi:MAG: serine/threonine-protein kinase [Ilumatobacteraceae bacterium]